MKKLNIKKILLSALALSISLTVILCTAGCSSEDDSKQTADTENSSEISEYILPKSSSELLSEDDINSLTDTQLMYAKNEIYARHGKIFEDDIYNKYIANMSWYTPNPNYSDSMLSDLEKLNIEMLNTKINTINASKAETTTVTETTTQATTQVTTVVVSASTPSSSLRYNDAEAEWVLNSYAYALITAINNGNYYEVAEYIGYGSPLETAQKKLVNNLYNKGTQESLNYFNVNDIVWSSDGLSCKAYVNEGETIYYADGSSESKDYSWIYTVEISDRAYVTNIERN